MALREKTNAAGNHLQIDISAVTNLLTPLIILRTSELARGPSVPAKSDLCAAVATACGTCN